MVPRASKPVHPAKITTLVVALACLVTFAAGCFGTGDPPAPGEEPTMTQEGNGRIEGKVVDVGLAPLAGVNVTLREPQRSVGSAADGTFVFHDLAPGTYTVFAQKPPTHRAAGKQVEVVARQVTEADLLLGLLPPPARPYSADLEFTGTIGCTFAYSPFNPGDLCGDGNPVEPVRDRNVESVHEFPMDAGLTGIAFQVDSQTTALGKPALHIAWHIPVALIESAHGDTPFHGSQTFEADLPQTESSYDGEENPLAQFSVRADKDAGSPQVAYQQQFQVYMRLFYNGAPIPEGFVPGPE